MFVPLFCFRYLYKTDCRDISESFNRSGSNARSDKIDSRDKSDISDSNETSLLRMLQAQTLPDEAPPVGKINLFSKIAVTFEPIQQF